jgi:hypothetical protein
VVSKEDLLAMKYTARSADHQRKHRGPDGAYFAMSNSHVSAVFDSEGAYFQALCECGWYSATSLIEEVDLLRALHVHKETVLKRVSVPPLTVTDTGKEQSK